MKREFEEGEFEDIFDSIAKTGMPLPLLQKEYLTKASCYAFNKMCSKDNYGNSDKEWSKFAGCIRGNTKYKDVWDYQQEKIDKLTKEVSSLKIRLSLDLGLNKIKEN